MFDVAKGQNYEEYPYTQRSDAHGEYTCPRCQETWRVDARHSVRDIFGIMLSLDEHRKKCGIPVELLKGQTTIQ